MDNEYAENRLSQEKLESLLMPVSDEYPSGDDLQFLPVFGTIKEARRADDPTLPQGDWVTSLKVAEWGKVIQLCEEAMRSQSKDLQLAAWYVEALIHQEGYEGAAFGFRLIAGLMNRFWETLYPRPYLDGSFDERIGKLEWMDIYLEQVLRRLPLVSPQHGGYDWYQWQASREAENLRRRDEDAYQAAREAGALCGDDFDKGARDSGAIWFKELIARIAEARAACDELARVVNERFGSEAPGLARICGSLEECGEVAQRFFGKYSGGAAVPAVSANGASAAPEAMERSEPFSGESTASSAGREEAVRQLRMVAYWFRSHEPHSPVALLVERAAHWAELTFEQWLSEVIKDRSTLERLGELLDTEIGIPAQETKA
jgi:type VI secretion system protein ImpA